MKLAEAGDIVIADFPGIEGVKRRPAVILSSETYHAVRPDVILGLITSQTAAAIGPTDYAIKDWQQSKLRVPSAFRAFITTIPKTNISGTIGRLSDADWGEVKTRIRTALASLEPNN